MRERLWWRRSWKSGWCLSLQQQDHLNWLPNLPTYSIGSSWWQPERSSLGHLQQRRWNGSDSQLWSGSRNWLRFICWRWFRGNFVRWHRSRRRLHRIHFQLPKQSKILRSDMETQCSGILGQTTFRGLRWAWNSNQAGWKFNWTWRVSKKQLVAHRQHNQPSQAALEGSKERRLERKNRLSLAFDSSTQDRSHQHENLQRKTFGRRLRKHFRQNIERWSIRHVRVLARNDHLV